MAVRQPMVWDPVTGQPQVLQPGDTIPGGAGVSFTEVEIDFGDTPVMEKNFTIVDATVSVSNKIMVVQSGSAPTGKNADDNELDRIDFVATAKAGSFDLYAVVVSGFKVAGKYKILYLKG